MQISPHVHTYKHRNTLLLWLYIFNLQCLVTMLLWRYVNFSAHTLWVCNENENGNIRAFCVAKSTSAEATSICHTEGWCTLKTHSLPHGTHIYHHFMATLPTLAHLCCDIHLCQCPNLHIRRPQLFLCPLSVYNTVLTGFTICSLCIYQVLWMLEEGHKIQIFLHSLLSS